MTNTTKSGLGEAEATAVCSAYLEAFYARLRQDYETPLPPLSASATNELRDVLTNRLRTMKLLGREAVNDASFELHELTLADAGPDRVKVRCVERYQLSFAMDSGDTMESSGQREHRFDLQADGQSVIIQSHSEREISSEELESRAARLEVAEASKRKSDEQERIAAKTEKSAAKKETKPGSSGDRAKVAVLVLLTAIILLAVAYKQAPRTREVRMSLHTGERHQVETLLGITVSDGYEPAYFTDWANERMQVPREEQRWVFVERRAIGWFKAGGNQEQGSSVPYFATQNLVVLHRLDLKNPRANDPAIAHYKNLVSELDESDYADRAAMIPTEATRDLPDFVAFSRTVLE